MRLLAIFCVFVSVASPAFASGFADMVEKVMPAVVTVSATLPADAKTGDDPQSNNPLDQLQKQFPFFNPHGGQQQRSQRPSMGSGFLISADGYIATSHHVVADADVITVTLGDGREFDADLVGSDEETDIALLRIDAEAALPFVTFGDSDALRLGDWVVAIGNPLSVGRSVTAGILSGRGRQREVGNLDDLLQTDVAINLGNSGGPLFNESGDVIGLVAFRHAEAAARGAGIAFAIPAARADVVISQLRDYGRPIRAWLGVSFRPVDAYVAEAVGLDSARGALVESVVGDSPAAKAGIRSGDIITDFDGKPVDGGSDLPWLVAQAPIGKAADVMIWRDGKALDVAVTLEEKPGLQPVVKNDTLPRQATESVKVLGITFRSANQRAAEQFGWPEGALGGVYVHRIDATAPAASLNLRPGDIVEEIEDEAINNPDQLATIIKKMQINGSKSAVLLKIRRGSGVTYIGLPLDR